MTVEGPNPEHVHGLVGPRLDEEGVPLVGEHALDNGEHLPESEPALAVEPEPTAGADGEAAEAEREAADDEPPPAARASKRLLAVVCIGLAVLSVAMGVLAAVLASRLDHERGDRRAVQDVSGRFAAALLTYDYTDLNAAKDRVLALSTRKFQKEYTDAFTGGLEVLVKETKTRSAGTVTDVFLGNISGGAATTIAVVNAVSQGTAGKNQLVSSYIELELVKLAGTWKVDNVTNLNFGQAAGAVPGVGAASTTTSSTPAPATSTTAPK